MATTVAVLGGGVGGLSAAQELAERGVAVTVYERRAAAGGKARSVLAPGSGFPGEHGFRFFPGFYRHLPDTMARIPSGGGARLGRPAGGRRDRFRPPRRRRADPVRAGRRPRRARRARARAGDAE